MNKTAFKTFISFAFLAAMAATILLDEEGDVAWSQNKPDDIPSHYSLNDIARIARWYLNDYPVYMYISDYGLLVLGMPKKSVSKYNFSYYAEQIRSLPARLLELLILNLCLAFVLSIIFGISLYRRIRNLMKGIDDLSREKNVCLKETGIFRELSQKINSAAAAMERKNLALARRDNARSNWVAGISHDIRTPLSLIMGYSKSLLESGGLSAENKKSAEGITAQSIKIKKLIEDLNLFSSLEYDMQTSQKTLVRLCPLVRRVVTDIINSGLSERFEINLDLQDEKAAVPADESLLERAVFNLINNSITHNKNGCRINISEYAVQGTVHLDISDNGGGVPDEIIKNIAQMPKSAHGLGLPMAYRIIRVHGGRFTAENSNGFAVKIELPDK